MKRAYRKLDLVAVDGSPAAERAVRFAVAQARYDESALTFVHIVENRGADAKDDTGVNRLPWLDLAMEHALSAAVQAHVRVLHGQATEMIIAATEALAPRIIFIGVNALTELERLFLGSVAMHVVTHSERPVIVVPASACLSVAADPLFSCVLVPIDPNDVGQSFLAEAFRLVGSKIEFCAVVDEGCLMRDMSQSDGIVIPIDDVIAAAHAHAESTIATCVKVARDAGVSAEGKVAVGEPSTTIAQLAVEKSVTSVVMATHGRTGLKRLFLGSTTEGVLRRSCVPVLTWQLAPALRTRRSQRTSSLWLPG